MFGSFMQPFNWLRAVKRKYHLTNLDLFGKHLPSNFYICFTVTFSWNRQLNQSTLQFTWHHTHRKLNSKTRAKRSRYHVSVTGSGILEVEEYWRVLVLLIDVFPQRKADSDTTAVSCDVIQTRLRSRQQFCLFQQPPGFHALALTVQHERPESVWQVVIGKELEVVLVEFKWHWKLRVNLQKMTNDKQFSSAGNHTISR